MAFLHMAVGDRVVAGGGEAMITHVVSAEQVIVRELITGVVRQVPVRTLRPAAALATPRLGQPDLSLVSDEDWTVAQVRYAAIKPLLEAVRIDRFALKQAAAGTGRHPATIYRWLRRYREERHQTALIPVKRGVEPWHSRLQPEVEAIIDAAIKDRYLTRNRVKATQLNRDVALKCRSAGLPIPHVNTVRNRISRIEPRTLVEGRSGKRAAQEQFEPIQGHFPSGNRPLAVVQIDHTKLDLIVVDQAERRPLARPWLTVAIDVFSRVVAGFYLSLEAPGAVSTGMGVACAILPKDRLLARWSMAIFAQRIEKVKLADFTPAVCHRPLRSWIDARSLHFDNGPPVLRCRPALSWS